MAEPLDLACPIMSRRARFDTDETGANLAEEQQDFLAA